MTAHLHFDWPIVAPLNSKQFPMVHTDFTGPELTQSQEIMARTIDPK